MRTRTLAAAFAVLLAGGAHAAGSTVDVRIVDRTTGETLPMHWQDGTWWVAGKPGSRYAIALTNRGAGRVLTVISVDGVNAISGDTAAPEQTGYVLSGGQHAQITGWRKSMSRVAAFEFTSMPNSYAARTGRPDNVGVIGVAVFREKARALPVPPLLQERSSNSAPAAPAAGASSDALASAEAARRSGPARESRIGTGHGRSETSETRYTAFDRASSTPDELIRIHYDSRENLVAMGVIPVPRGSPDPFPAAAGFVPDPPRR